MAVRVRVPLAALTYLSLMQMKRIAFLFLTLLLLVSCGTRSGYFKMKGRFLHMNSGELYLYSPDGGIDGMDTIKIEAGRFAYEIPCATPSTLVMIFPNFSTQPIFAEEGEAVEVKADASHLKEMEVSGTDNNELMTKFRKQIATASPPDILKYAVQFVNDHPESIVSTYLVRKYLIETETPDYKQALKLINLMLKEQPKNVTLVGMKQLLLTHGNARMGTTLPRFKTKDVNGKVITNADLKGKTVFINTWASWSFESMELQRAINDAVKEGKAVALGICVDPDAKVCKQLLKSNDIQFANVCDGNMLETKLLKTFNLSTIPDNIVIRNGRIVERNVTANTVRQRLSDNKL